ncbi:hypothetical protein MIND_00665100 [Mycena indigotica]|uniref:Uncharacterized protein n=1 Tax=Mycena indigotica TaxID=2126181 RepID=A0A8H6SNF7_9AGAR|nr:uncharacterized protein MIND_00665100 [Mycena indigotica]KAF7301015.1 hypothetical protein MIND_00665100 [Mycena indigotica]
MAILAPSLSPPPAPSMTAAPKPFKNAPATVFPPNGEAMPTPDTESPIPRLALDVDSISAGLASALATSVVAHVLFLKNQVPFPIMQLSRLPNGKSAPRALKLRTELLTSFDTLSSHLDTTFTALSTAMALCRRNQNRADGTCRAQLAILVGPSIGAAKTKVIFVVDGLAARVWGERDDSDEDESGDSESESESDGEDASEPPESDSEEEVDNEESSESEAENSSSPPRPKPRIPFSPAPSTPPTSRGPHAPRETDNEQQLIRTATRQLSHAMATAESLSAELSSTQTHILLHAPRRFKHPAWVPRQTVGNAMDRAAASFAEQLSGDIRATKRKQKVEGVWVGCRTTSELLDGEDEEDEMIWWSWDGKIVGFSDW